MYSASNNSTLAPEEKDLLQLQLQNSEEGQAARDEAADSRGGFLSSLGDFLGITDGKFGVQDEKNKRLGGKPKPLMYKPRENAKNYSKKETDRYDKAVRSGDDDAIRRMRDIAALRARQDRYAELKKTNPQAAKDYADTSGMSVHSVKQADKFDGSLQSAIKSGNAVKEGTGGFFSKYVYKANPDKKDED